MHESVSQTEAQQLIRKQELKDIGDVLETDAGRRLFKRMFRLGRIYSTSFTGNSQTYFLEGHRNFALTFFRDVCEVAPSMIPDLMMEQVKEQGDTSDGT